MQKVCTDEDMLKNQILKYDLQWFAKDGEGGEKTEPATAKKLKDAREEGKGGKKPGVEFRIWPNCAFPLP